jgi:signal transduction histidine kinase
MLLTLISKDPALPALCRDLLRDLGGNNWELRCENSIGPTLLGDVCIWDYEADRGLPAEIYADDAWKHVFLVHPHELESLREQITKSDVQILLKPVTRAMLRTCLEGFISSSGRSATLAALEGDRTNLLQCLMEMNLKLQEYDQQRTNFLSRAVHDFRAPLTSLCGYCDLLLAGELGEIAAAQREVLNRMRHSAKRLSRMSWAMFELSVGQHGERRLHLEPADLRGCLDQAVHEMLPAVRAKAIELSTELLPSIAPLHFDKSQMEQVFLNILDNACKFLPKGGLIRVTGYPFFWERRLSSSAFMQSNVDRRLRSLRAPNAYRVDIRDTGPGIPPEHLDGIFEEYTQYHGPEDRSGGGLGLAICRVILGRHKGHIWADSGPSGAVFSFVLPTCLQDQPADEPVSRTPSFVGLV